VDVFIEMKSARTEKVSNRQMFSISTLRNFCITAQKCMQEIRKLHLFGICCFASGHVERCEHIQVIITWSLVNYSSFTEWSSVCNCSHLQSPHNQPTSIPPPPHLCSTSSQHSLFSCGYPGSTTNIILPTH